MNTAIDWRAVSTEYRREAKSAVKVVTRVIASAPWLAGIKDDDAYAHALDLYEALLALVPDEDDQVEPDGDMKALVWVEGLLGRALAEYAEFRWPFNTPPGGTPAAILRVIMDEHELTQSDLPEIGSQGVVSEILAGKREMNLRQLKWLSHHFGVPARFFLES